jgi:hypothetical protein
MLANLGTLTHFSYLVLAEHASMQEWDGKMHISTQGYHDIPKYFDFSVYLKLFLVLPQARKN